jgi:obg-like ATPase 1
VPDPRFDALVAAHKPKSVVPAVLTVTDIAGLVKGAAEGAGLGNAFLSNIAAVDGIFHVCRAFAGDEIVHVEGRVDPVADLEIIHNELRLKDIATVSGQVESKRKGVERGLGGKDAKAEFVSLEKVRARHRSELKKKGGAAKSPTRLISFQRISSRHLTSDPLAP